MSDLAADMNQMKERKSRQSIFDSSKFWGHKKSLNKDIEIYPAITIKDESLEQLPEIPEKGDSIENHPKITVINDSIEHHPKITVNNDPIEHHPKITVNNDPIEQIPENNHKPSKPDDVKLYDTINGNFIITRGWDGTNMSVYQIRRKYI